MAYRKPRRKRAPRRRVRRRYPRVGRTEIKCYNHVDSIQTVYHDASTKILYDVTQLGHGTSEDTRIGNLIFTRWIGLRIAAEFTTPATATRSSTVRFIMFRATADLPVAADFAAMSLWDSLAIQNRKEVAKVIFEKQVSLSLTGNQKFCKKFFIPIFRHVKWISTTTTDYKSGGLWLLVITDGDATGGINSQVDIRWQVDHSFADK